MAKQQKTTKTKAKTVAATKASPAKKSAKPSSSKANYTKFLIIAFVVLFAAIGSYFVFLSKAGAPTLTWAPPTGYENYPVKNVGVSTATQTISGGGGDMLVKLPNSPTGPINLTNCRNVVIIGGQINIPPNSGPGTDMRGIYVNGCTGIVHIEGVYINGDIATAEGDGIAIKAPQAIVQVQNVRIYKLYGGFDTASHNHSDIIQPWGGVKELRIDYLTGSSNYQGFQINEDQGAIGAVTIKNTNIGDSGVPSADGKGGYYVWLKCGTGTKYSFSNMYVQPRSGRSLANSVWDGSCGIQATSSSLTFSNSAASGSILNGKPVAGDFVPAGAAGIGYKSPGYGGAPAPVVVDPAPSTPTVSNALVNESFDSASTSMQQVLGGWQLKSGRYALSTVKNATSGNGNISVNPTVLTGDFTLSADALVTGTSNAFDDFSLIFGYVDANNYYYASFNESNDDGTNGIFKISNGTMTQLKDFTSLIKVNTNYKVQVVKSGNTYTVSRDGAMVGSVTDTSFASGKVGFGSRNNAVSFDNLTVVR